MMNQNELKIFKHEYWLFFFQLSQKNLVVYIGVFAHNYLGNYFQGDLIQWLQRKIKLYSVNATIFNIGYILNKFFSSRRRKCNTSTLKSLIHNKFCENKWNMFLIETLTQSEKKTRKDLILNCNHHSVMCVCSSHNISFSSPQALWKNSNKLVSQLLLGRRPSHPFLHFLRKRRAK